MRKLKILKLLNIIVNWINDFCIGIKEQLASSIKNPKNLGKTAIIFLAGYFLTTMFFPGLFAPHTNIDPQCYYDINSKRLTFEFTNNAKWAGENFIIRIFDKNIRSNVPLSMDPVSNRLCTYNVIILGPTTTGYSDTVEGLEVKCDFIPPKSKLNFTYSQNHFVGDFEIEYFGKTTPLKRERITCNNLKS